MNNPKTDNSIFSKAAWKALPLGSIKGEGWLKERLEIGAAGMGGHLNELEPDMCDKPFQTRDYDIHKGGCCDNVGWCSEISGEYWLGLVELAHTLDDPALKEKADRWIEKVLALQEPDGYLGSYRKTDNRFEDFHTWGSRLCYRALLYYYEMTGDKKYLDAVHRGLLWFVNTWTGDKKTDYVGDTIIEQMALVATLTGDRRLIDWSNEYADWMDRNGGENTFFKQTLRLGHNHVGALSTRAVLPALLEEAGGRAGGIRASEEHVADMDRDIGWQANYAPSSDREHVSMPSCISESEYCDSIYYMENFLHLARITGKADYATRVERIAFNAAMGARRKDDRAMAYKSSPNQFRATIDSAQFSWHEYYEAYAPNHNACCCAANSVRLWPEYLRQAILKKDGEYYVQLYGPMVMKDGPVKIRLETEYPFEHTVKVEVKTIGDTKQKTTVRFRKPDWADEMDVAWNADRTRATVNFKCSPRVRAVADRDFPVERLRSIEYGPLVFVQPLVEKWEKAVQPTNCEQLPPDWSWFNVTCAEKPVIYAMPADVAYQGRGIEIVNGRRLRVPMIRATEAYDGNPATKPHNNAPRANPVAPDRDAAVEMVEFVPYWETALRVTCFPVAFPQQSKPIVIPAPMISKGLPGERFVIKAQPEDVDPNCDRIPIGLCNIPQMLKRAMTVERITSAPEAKGLDEEYWLRVDHSGIRVRAFTEAGEARALASLRQLAIRANWDSTELVVEGYETHDWPKFAYRGLHLDECRHFFGKKCVKKLLDLMHLHKFNKLHWHLTDDQGWRIDLPGHPELAKFGAVRPESADTCNHELGDGVPYGPYCYTPDDIREIVAYAAERRIDIIPEIEMPGHVRALLASHPEFSCTGNVPRSPRVLWGIEQEVLCAGNDDALAYMKGVLDEVITLFPDDTIHIGGDECPKERWKACPKCQRRMKELGLKDEAALESWFAGEMAKHLKTRGRKAIGWDEIFDGGTLVEGTRIMNYFGPAKGAGETAAGYDIVANNSAKCYFDLPQLPKSKDCYNYFWWGTTPTLEVVYNFDPYEGIAEDDRAHVLGGQGDNWTEYTTNWRELEWKCWPRACALAEVLWTYPQWRDIDKFRDRLRVHVRRLKELGIHVAPLV